MAQITPVAGKNVGVTWTPAGGAVTLYVTEHSWSEMIDAIDTTHTGTSGQQSLLAGILRGEGTVKAFLDATSSATAFLGATQTIIAGTNGTLTHSLSSAYGYVIPCMITRVVSSVPVTGGINYEFTVILNDLAATGTYARDGAT